MKLTKASCFICSDRSASPEEEANWYQDFLAYLQSQEYILAGICFFFFATALNTLISSDLTFPQLGLLVCVLLAVLNLQ